MNIVRSSRLCGATLVLVLAILGTGCATAKHRRTETRNPAPTQPTQLASNAAAEWALHPGEVGWTLRPASDTP